jgi:hypothetical protein
LYGAIAPRLSPDQEDLLPPIEAGNSEGRSSQSDPENTQSAPGVSPAV